MTGMLTKMNLAFENGHFEKKLRFDLKWREM
jgi:hypothetical protein